MQIQSVVAGQWNVFEPAPEIGKLTSSKFGGNAVYRNLQSLTESSAAVFALSHRIKLRLQDLSESSELTAVRSNDLEANMPNRKTRLLSVLLVLPVSALLASLLLCASAIAQCSPFQQRFENIALVSSNPFVAEYATTGVSTIVTPAPTLSHGGLKSVARDSAGRVRIVRSAGKYDVKPPEGSPSETEPESIWICDPATSTFIVLDTANKTATVYGRHGGTRWITTPAQEQGAPFCTRFCGLLDRSRRHKVEDLGHQLISGYDALGIRIHVVPLVAKADGFTNSSYEELWCSDDLGAVLQQSTASESSTGKGLKQQSTMLNIERREPDASLFQIPPDYTVLERTPNATVTASGKVHTEAPPVPPGNPQ